MVEGRCKPGIAEEGVGQEVGCSGMWDGRAGTGRGWGVGTLSRTMIGTFIRLLEATAHRAATALVGTGLR